MSESAYARITERILALLEEGVVPWQRPWRVRGGPRNLSGRPYRGVNALLLACQGYDSPHWLTYRQAAKVGGHVRRGERGCAVVLWRPVERRPRREPGQGEDASTADTYLLIRTYVVFNAEQCDLPPGSSPRSPRPRSSRCPWPPARPSWPGCPTRRRSPTGATSPATRRARIAC